MTCGTQPVSTIADGARVLAALGAAVPELAEPAGDAERQKAVVDLVDVLVDMFGHSSLTELRQRDPVLYYKTVAQAGWDPVALRGLLFGLDAPPPCVGVAHAETPIVETPPAAEGGLCGDCAGIGPARPEGHDVTAFSVTLNPDGAATQAGGKLIAATAGHRDDALGAFGRAALGIGTAP